MLIMALKLKKKNNMELEEEGISIPDEYKIRYGITNLFRVELPNFWRMLYTLIEGESKIEVISFILDIIDHPNYDKKFRYK